MNWSFLNFGFGQNRLLTWCLSLSAASHVGALAAVAYFGLPLFGRMAAPGTDQVLALELTVTETIEEEPAVEFTYLEVPETTEQPPMDAQAMPVARSTPIADAVPPPNVPATEARSVSSVIEGTAGPARQLTEASSKQPTFVHQPAAPTKRQRTISKVAHLTVADLPVGTLVDAAPVRNPRPRYPAVAIRQRIEGRVVLRVTIAADGRVSDIEVADSSGFAVLDNAATNALRQWRFTPATRDGQRVESTLVLPVRFRLNR